MTANEVVEEKKEVSVDKSEGRDSDGSEASEGKVEEKPKKKAVNKTKKGAKTVPDYKKKIVDKLSEKLKDAKTILLASTKGLPGGQYHAIKKSLRGKANLEVAKKSLLFRALDKTDKEEMKKLKENIGADVALFFSDMDAFELSGLLSENQTPIRAKAGDIAPEDISIEPGPTDMLPGPAISELSGVGLKVAVEDGKIAIKKGAVVVKAGEVIKENVAGVLGKLNITPMKAGFEPIAAYDAEADKVYVGIKIDKEAALETLREAIGKGLGFAVDLGYVCSGTIGYFIAKAGAEEKALSEKLGGGEVAEEKTEEEGEKSEEVGREEQSSSVPSADDTTEGKVEKDQRGSGEGGGDKVEEKVEGKKDDVQNTDTKEDNK